MSFDCVDTYRYLPSMCIGVLNSFPSMSGCIPFAQDLIFLDDYGFHSQNVNQSTVTIIVFAMGHLFC